jgi:hypothetical protein
MPAEEDGPRNPFIRWEVCRMLGEQIGIEAVDEGYRVVEELPV